MIAVLGQQIELEDRCPQPDRNPDQTRVMAPVKVTIMGKEAATRYLDRVVRVAVVYADPYW